MPAPILISSYQCARLLQTSKEHVRKLLDSGKIDYFRDNYQVFRIRLDSVMEYASRSGITIDYEYYKNLTSRFTPIIWNSGIADASALSEQKTDEDGDSIPAGKTLWKTGVAIAERFKNRKFLSALYMDERLAGIMFRYFSGESLEKIGGAYGITRERVRQLCKKGVNQLMHHISFFTKDVVEMSVDVEARANVDNHTMGAVGLEGINGMRFSKRARTVFIKHGIKTVEQLQRLSKSELMKLPGLGRKTLVEILRVLEYAEAPDSSQKAHQLRPWTEADIEQVMALKRLGKSFQEIAAQVDRFTIDVQDQYYIRKRALRDDDTLSGSISQDSTEEKDTESRRHPVLWTEKESAQLVTMRSRGMYVRDIAGQLQRNQREVSSKLEELGLKIRYRNLADLADEEKEGLVERFHQGESLADLAEEQKLKQIDLAQLLIERGELPERNVRSGQPWKQEETETLRSYIEWDYPIGEIGYRLGRDHREITSKIYELVKAIR